MMEKDQVLEIWGESFEDLCDNPQVEFSESHIKVTLKRSPELLTSSGERTKVLVFEEPDLSTLKLMDSQKGDFSKVAALIQGCAGLPAASANKIKASDFIILSRVVAAFLGSVPKTYGTQSEI